MSVEHYENFPVASLLCPPALRPCIIAIYHFARTADDIADEGEAPPEDRLAELRLFRADLQAVLAGREPSPRWRPVFVALGTQQARHQLPPACLHALLDAFEQDVGNPVYGDWDALLGYCRRSADPIGRLLMHLYGLAAPDDLRQSDAICSALQLINFWQDLSVDGPRGRCYVPQQAAQAHGLSLQDVLAGRDSPQARAMVRDLCERSAALMRQGAPLALRVPGRAGWELRLVVQGGLRVLQKIRQMDHATLTRRPSLTLRDAPVLLWRAMAMRRAAA